MIKFRIVRQYECTNFRNIILSEINACIKSTTVGCLAVPLTLLMSMRIIIACCRKNKYFKLKSFIFLHRWASQNDSHHFNVGVIFSTPVSNNKSEATKKRTKETRFNLPKDDLVDSLDTKKCVVFGKHISNSLEMFPVRRLSKVRRYYIYHTNIQDYVLHIFNQKK